MIVTENIVLIGLALSVVLPIGNFAFLIVNFLGTKLSLIGC